MVDAKLAAKEAEQIHDLLNTFVESHDQFVDVAVAVAAATATASAAAAVAIIVTTTATKVTCYYEMNRKHEKKKIFKKSDNSMAREWLD